MITTAEDRALRARMRRIRLEGRLAELQRQEQAIRTRNYRKRMAVRRTMARSTSHADPVFLAWVTRQGQLLEDRAEARLVARARADVRAEARRGTTGGYGGYRGEISRGLVLPAARCSFVHPHPGPCQSRYE